MLATTDAQASEEFARRVRDALGEGVRVWAFGSRARGDATWESDLDVCIVVPELRDNDRRTIRHLAWEVGFEDGLVLNTVVFDKRDFEEGVASESSIVRRIREEGVSI